jgi:hypothetical protein
MLATVESICRYILNCTVTLLRGDQRRLMIMIAFVQSNQTERTVAALQLSEAAVALGFFCLEKESRDLTYELYLPQVVRLLAISLVPQVGVILPAQLAG